MIRKLLVRTVAAGTLAVGAILTTAGPAQALPRGDGYCHRLLQTAQYHVDQAHGFLEASRFASLLGHYQIATQHAEAAEAHIGLGRAAVTAYELDC